MLTVKYYNDLMRVGYSEQIHCKIWKTILCQVSGILRCFFLQHTTMVNKMDKLRFIYLFTYAELQEKQHGGLYICLTKRNEG